MRASRAFLFLTASFALAAAAACAEDDGKGTCITTHRDVPDQRYEGATLDECDEYCSSVGGYVCCYFQPASAPWVEVDGEC
jgi:hypothetical protein